MSISPPSLKPFERPNNGKLIFLNRPYFHIAIVALVGFAAYSNTFGVPFQFDDYLINLRQVGNISGIPSLFTDIKSYFGSRPLLLATLGMNYHFGGLDTWGYHAVNLTLHLVNGALLYFLVLMTGKRLGYGESHIRQAAFLSACLFVLHPVQTEAVTYIVSRSALLATTFYFAGMILFLKAVTVEKPKGIFIAGLLIVSLLGMASRENFATFPLMLILYDLLFISRFRLREVLKHYKAYAPAVLSLGYMAYIIVNNTYNKSIYQPGVGIPLLDYSLTQFNVHWTYLRLLVLPVGQNIDYDYPLAKTLFSFPTLFSFIGYLGLWAGGIVFARKRPVVSFAILWFLITLLPISFAIILTGVSLDYVISEHRLYLPVAGIFVVVAYGGVLLPSRLKSARLRTVAMAAMVIVPLLLAVTTYERNTVWQSAISLWEDSVNKSPRKAGTHNNIGLAYYERAYDDRAMEHFNTAIKLDPRFAKAYNNLGLVYRRMGLQDMALENFLNAVKMDPRLAKAHNNIGTVYSSKGAYGKAAEHFAIALSLDPDYANAHNNLGVVYQNMGRFDTAIIHLSAAIELEPDSAMAYNNLGAVFIRMGQGEKALQNLRTSLALNPNYVEAHINLGTVLLSRGRTEEAIEHFRIAATLRPDFALAHGKLGLAYQEMGLPDKAEEHFRRARELTGRAQ